MSTWTASKVFDRIILHNFRYCVQQQVGMTKLLTNFSIRILQLIRKNLNLFHRPEKTPLTYMIGIRGGVRPSRHCQRQCKFFASGANFSIFTHFLCFFLLKLLKLGEIDGVKFLA